MDSKAASKAKSECLHSGTREEQGTEGQGEAREGQGQEGEKNSPDFCAVHLCLPP